MAMRINSEYPFQAELEPENGCGDGAARIPKRGSGSSNDREPGARACEAAVRVKNTAQTTRAAAGIAFEGSQGTKGMSHLVPLRRSRCLEWRPFRTLARYRNGWKPSQRKIWKDKGPLSAGARGRLRMPERLHSGGWSSLAHALAQARVRAQGLPYHRVRLGRCRLLSYL